MSKIVKSPVTLVLLLAALFAGMIWIGFPKKALAATTWYASNRTTTGGAGTLGDPWDLHTAFHAVATIQPGDTLNLRGGTYVPKDLPDACNTADVSVTLQGTVANRITIQSRPGEWAILNVTGCTYGIAVATTSTYVDFRDFEMYRTDVRSNSFQAGIITLGETSHSRQINLVIHDITRGSGTSSDNAGSDLIYGGLYSYNGDPLETPSHDHGIYNSHLHTKQVVKDTISFNNEGNCYALDNKDDTTTGIAADLIGNIGFNCGILGVSADAYNVYNGRLGSGLWDTNLLYRSVGFGSTTDVMRFGQSYIGCVGLTISNSFFHGPVLWTNCLSGLAINGTTFYYPAGGLDVQANSSADPRTAFPTGSYPGSPPNTYTNTRPTQPWKLVRPNLFESGRGNIGIVNWALSPTVSVDVSSVLTTGHNWSLYWAPTFRGKLNSVAVQSGSNFGGSSITINMSAYAMPVPLGTPAYAAPSSPGPEFGAFILFDEGGGATPTPVNTPSITPTFTKTNTPSNTPSRTPTFTATRTFTASNTPTGTIVATNTATQTFTQSRTPTITNTPTITQTPSTHMKVFEHPTCLYVGPKGRYLKYYDEPIFMTEPDNLDPSHVHPCPAETP